MNKLIVVITRFHSLYVVLLLVVVSVLPVGIPSDASAAVLIPASARVDGVGVNPGLNGFFYDRNDPPEVILTLAMADSIIASDPVAATFQATLVDYPNDPMDIAFLGTLGDLLGADAVSLAPPSAAGVDASPMVMRFSGFIQIDPAFDTQPSNSTIDVVFSLGSDDGSRLRIGGQTVISIDPGTPVTAFPGVADVARFEAPGLYPLEIVWFDHYGGIGLEFSSSIPGGPNSGGPAGTVGIVPTSVLFQPVTPSGKVYMGSKPKGKAHNLIVLVHGCCTNKKGVKEWSDLGRLIKETISQSHTPKDWEIVVLDWSKDTPTHDYIKCPHCFPEDASSAYIAAEISHGPNLAIAIAGHPYEYVHLIGHSAGAKLIDEAAFRIALDDIDKPFLHLTFLDAYTRDDNDTINYGGLPVGYPHYVEHYVDRGFPSTDACLSNAFNFNISNWLHSLSEGGFGGHQWPRVWYKNSVTATPQSIPEFKYGFTLSLEGSGKNINKLLNELAKYPAGQQCELSTFFNNNPKCQPAACW